MEMMTVQEGWESYEEEVVTKKAGPVQRRETRMAFYGGASAVLEMLAAISDEEAYTEEGAIEILEGLREEVALFAAMMGGD